MDENNTYNANGQQGYQAPQQSYQAPQQTYQAQQQTYQPQPQQPVYQQNAYQASGYQQPVYQAPQQTAPVMKIKDWLIMFLISIIPCVGIIMVFVWAFGSGQNPNKSNYAKASLIWSLIIAGVSLILYVIILLFFSAWLQEFTRQLR